MSRELVFSVLRFTGIPFLIREILQRNKVAILCYHDLPPEIAYTHFMALKERYNIISLKHYIESRRGKSGIKLPPRSLIITIDDGHKENYKLKSVIHVLEIPVTIFLCSAIVGTGKHYWWTALDDDARVSSLKTIPDGDRVRALAGVGFEELRAHEDRQALSNEEISDLRAIVDFQSHSRLHPILPRCPPERAREEIRGSKKELESVFGLDIYAFAYPNGDYSDREIVMVKESGYECALTLDGGANSGDTDLFRLKRLHVYDYADINELIVKASGLWAFLERIIGRHQYGYNSASSDCSGAS